MSTDNLNEKVNSAVEGYELPAKPSSPVQEESPEDRYNRAVRECQADTACFDRRWGLRTLTAQILVTVLIGIGAWWYCRQIGHYEHLYLFAGVWFAVITFLLVSFMIVPATVDTIRKRRYLKGLKAEVEAEARARSTTGAKEAA